MATLLHGDCLQVMATLPADSLDAIVTDPPYGLAFMGKAWDHGVPGEPFWQAALRVAKPGAHILAFGGTRTYHRLTCAIEDAGWEIRDCLMWLYGSGFPKSLDVSKAIDKAAGAERPIVGARSNHRNRPITDAWRESLQNKDSGYNGVGGVMGVVTAPATDAARQWDGWGTALKPAWEPIILARKPLVGTVAANVQAYGTGAVNVDACRIGTGDDRTSGGAQGAMPQPMSWGTATGRERPTGGRWPANLLLDFDSATALDAQTGTLTSGNLSAGHRQGAGMCGGGGVIARDYGGASRFFYCAKASRADRNAGCDALTAQQQDDSREPDAPGANNPRNRGGQGRTNHHPTVKPTDVMRWLVRLVTPPGGTVLDPFMGSGSTGKAARLEGMAFIGIEQDAAYLDIARARIEAA
jgi:DNA modification methylase